MTSQSRTLVTLTAGVVLLMAAALAADVAISTGTINVIGQPSTSSGAVVRSEMQGSWPTGRAIEAYVVTTGTAVLAQSSGGAGIYGASTGSYGVWGYSYSSWGGLFSSGEGYGIRVDTAGTDHYDHGAYITSVGGYGVYAQSAGNMGVRGEAGNVAGLAQPAGPVGVVGIGSSRGVFGSSSSGIGVYGTTDSSYGVWGHSETYRGVTGRTDRTDNNYGLYTPDNLYSLNYNLTGAVMQVAHNGGDEVLEAGDVVEFRGISLPKDEGPLDGEADAGVAAPRVPIVQVALAREESSATIAGVVFSRFNIDAVDDSEELPFAKSEDLDEDLARKRGTNAGLEVTPSGPVSPGEYLLVVVQGPARVKASATVDAIGAGDDLVVGHGYDSGRAVMADSVLSAKSLHRPSILGAALQPLAAGEDTIYAYVSPR